MKNIMKVILVFILSFVLINCAKEREKDSYEVILDWGNDVDRIVLSVEEGEKLAAPELIEKEGYTFLGWYKGEIKWIFEQYPVTENLTLKAKWKANEYTISFVANGGTETLAITQEYGTKVNKPADPVREGYTFLGWNKEFPETMPADNLLLKAVWEANDITLSFDTDGGTEISPITGKCGEAYEKPANPEKEGYVFLGWSENLPDKMPTSNITYTALWEEVINNISDVEVGGKFKLKGTVYFTYDKYIILNDPTGMIIIYSENNDIIKGDVIIVSGICNKVDNSLVINESVEISKIGSDEVKESTPKELDIISISSLLKEEKAFIKLVKVKGILLKEENGDYYLSIEGLNVICRIPNSFDNNNYKKYVNTSVELAGYYISSSTLKGNEFTILPMALDEMIVYYDVKYVVDGAVLEEISIRNGDFLKQPIDPLAENRVFIGWFNNGSKWDFNSTVSSNMILTAKFTSLTAVHSVKDFTLKYDFNSLEDDELSSINTITIALKYDASDVESIEYSVFLDTQYVDVNYNIETGIFLITIGNISGQINNDLNEILEICFNVKENVSMTNITVEEIKVSLVGNYLVEYEIMYNKNIIIN